MSNVNCEGMVDEGWDSDVVVTDFKVNDGVLDGVVENEDFKREIIDLDVLPDAKRFGVS